MVGLHKSDSDIANSIMKQIAENNLYEQELRKQFDIQREVKTTKSLVIRSPKATLEQTTH